MALKRLTTAEMVSLTAPWLEPSNAEHRLLAHIPETRVLLAHVERAQQALVRTQPSTAPDAALAAIQAREHVVDARHDNVVRGIHATLTGLAFLARDAARSTALLHLRDTLLPDGVSLVQRSLRDEAGHATLLHERLGRSENTQLRALTTPDGTLLDAVHEWTSLATELGTLEDQRSAVDAPSTVTLSDAAKARNKWIQAVNAVISALDVAEVDDATAAKALKRIRDAERKAERRAASGDTGSGTEPAPAAPGTPAVPTGGATPAS